MEIELKVQFFFLTDKESNCIKRSLPLGLKQEKNLPKELEP